MRWQRLARLGIAVIAVAFAVLVGTTMKRRQIPQTPPPVAGADPTAIVESQGGNTVRVSGTKQDGTLAYDRLLTYASGVSRMVGVTITSERGGKTFVIKAKDGEVGANDSAVQLTGGVRMESSDGLVLVAEEATYVKSENVIRVPGAATFTRARMTGSGTGLDYDQPRDVLRIAEHAVLDVAADAQGAGALSMRSATLEFNRVDKIVHLDREVSIARDGQTVASDQAVAHLSPDEERLDLLELRGSSRVQAAPGSSGGLESATGQNMNLHYGGASSTLQRAIIDGSAAIRLTAARAQAGRTITAATMTLGLAPDGATVSELVAREQVRMTLPATEAGGATRTIASQTLDSTGDGTNGITGARFAGNVQFAEKGGTVDRAARSGVLEVTMASGFGALEHALFTRAVRFEDGPLYATAAVGRYAVASGALDLSGSEPGSPRPHVLNEQIAVDATQVDITLDGPIMRATGAVKSVIQPKKRGDASDAAHLPAMLKSDQPVNVTAEHLTYDGPSSKATYAGTVLLWQAETSIKGSAITIDSKSGDLTAEGPVATSAVMLQEAKSGAKERVASIGTSKAFAYVDTLRRATYTGDAHLTGPQGDLTSPRIELFLKPSGDELERAEAYDGVTLRGSDRKTTGTRLTYFGADQRYVVTGAPVTILDECQRETTGRTLTFYRATDRIVVDGNEQTRTQTRGSSSTCP